MVIAKQRHDDGENDIYNFIVNKTQKALRKLVSTAWKIQNAPAILERNSKSRIEILNEYANTACVENCNGEWFLYAKEVLKNNSINLYVYAEAIRQCLKNDRQKQNNIMLVGPTNWSHKIALNCPHKILWRVCDVFVMCFDVLKILKWWSILFANGFEFCYFVTNDEKRVYQDLILHVNEKVRCKFHEVLHSRTYKQKKQNKLEETKQTNKNNKLEYNIKTN